MEILDLSLSYRWFDMIQSGEKKEEYRELKPFYWSRLWHSHAYRHYDAIRFHRGQGSRVTMLVQCLGVKIGRGNPAWGAPVGYCFIIKLGNIIS